MYSIPNFFKYTYFPYDSINVKKDFTYNDRNHTEYIDLSMLDLNNDFIKKNYNRILIKSNNDNLYKEIVNVHKKKTIEIVSDYEVKYSNVDLMIIDINYMNNIQLIHLILNSLYYQKEGSNMIFKIKLSDSILNNICFFLSAIYNKLSLGKIDVNNYLIVKCEHMLFIFHENILDFNNIMSNIRHLLLDNINILSIIENDDIPQIYKNRFNEILKYIDIDK